MRVFLGGEGKDELGRFCHDPAYAVERRGRREVEKEPGILETLINRLKKTPIEFVGGLVWHRIPKGRITRGIHRAETRNVVGLVLDAEDARCDAAIFVRDRDGDENREADVEEGIRVAKERFPAVLIVGGMAIEEIEAWLLAMLGEHKSERHAHPKEVLRDRQGIETTAQKSRVVEEASLENLPGDADSLHRWIDRFESALAPGDN